TSTVTLVGSDGDDVVDVSGLTSAHRIVFKSEGGNDIIRGNLRSQDEIHLMAGKKRADYSLKENGDGTSTLSTTGHSITYKPSGGQPKFVEVSASGSSDSGGQSGGGTKPSDDQGPPPQPKNSLPTVPGQIDLRTVNGNTTLTILASALLAGTHDANGDTLWISGLTASAGTLELVAPGKWVYTPALDFSGSVTFAFRVSDGKGSVAHSAKLEVLPVTPIEENPPSGSTLFGTEADDSLNGSAGDDAIFGQAGNDQIQAGSGDDVVFGGDGSDTIMGGDGDDMLFG